MTTDGKHALRATSVDVALGGQIVLQDFSASIGPGELVAVIGSNGAGKSTALKVLAGLAPRERGEVMLDGVSLDGLDRRALGRAVAYLPQERAVYWPLAVERVVALGRLPHKTFSAADSQRDRAAIMAAMARMDVTQLAQRPIVTLSGGERARVLVARALAQEARYLIADEPTAGLDPVHSLHLFEEFKRLTTDGVSVIVALHDLSLALRYADRALLLAGGKCIADGPAASVITRERLAEAFRIDAIVTKIEGLPVVLPSSSLS